MKCQKTTVPRSDAARSRRANTCVVTVCVEVERERESREEGDFRRERLINANGTTSPSKRRHALVKIDFRDLVVAKSNKWRMISKGQKWKGGCKGARTFPLMRFPFI